MKQKQIINYEDLSRTDKREVNRICLRALGHIIKTMVDMSGINSSNWLQEFFDNVLGYGGNNSIAKIIINEDDSISVVIANDKSIVSDKDFEYGWLTKPIDYRPIRDRSKSSGQSSTGGSLLTYNFGYFEKVGYRNEFLKYRIATYNYKFIKDDITIDQLSAQRFKDYIDDINVTIDEVTEQEWFDTHNMGDTYDGWFYQFKLFKNGIKIDKNRLEKFIQMRYNERSHRKDMVLSIDKKGKNIFHSNINSYVFPTAKGEPLKSIYEMIELYPSGLNSKNIPIDTKNKIYTLVIGDTNDTLNCKKYSFHARLYHGVPPSDIERIDYLQTNYLGRLFPNHFGNDDKRMEKPLVDVYSADGTYITSFTLYSPKNQWPAEHNYIRISIILTEKSDVPFAFKKDEFRDPEFIDKIREELKKTINLNKQNRLTTGQERKKKEDEMVVRHKESLFNSNNKPNDKSKAYTNTIGLLNVDSIKSKDDVLLFQTNDTSNECDEIIEANGYHLLEWQQGLQDDNHYYGFIGRLMDPKKDWTTCTWVCEKISDNYLNKLKDFLTNPNTKFKPNIELEKVQIIEVVNLYKELGYQNAKVVWTKK